MGTKEAEIKENLKVIEAIERPSLIKFGILLFIFILMLKRSLTNASVLQGMHIAFLMWSFFVLCVPVSRGKILFGIPYYLKTGKRLKFPEIIAWGFALAGNMLTLATSSSIYYQSRITSLLLIILEGRWLLWTIILMCCIATFYDSVVCNYTHARTNLKKKSVCRILVLISFFVTFLLTLPHFWVFG